MGAPDAHINERLSLIELGFRDREIDITDPSSPTSNTDALIATMLRGYPNVNDGVDALRAERVAKFRVLVEELNASFRPADYPLHYHNGFIQLSTDNLVQERIEAPFWAVVSDAAWKNVDHDMKEALDLRDSGGRDPTFYAARALESAIKIASDRKGWTHGGEKGAFSDIDKLVWLNDGSCVRLRPERPNHVWSDDFVQDQTEDKRPFRMLTIIDEFTRRCLAIVVARRLRSDDVLHCLTDLMSRHGPPEHIRSDNGPEFVAKACAPGSAGSA